MELLYIVGVFLIIGGFVWLFAMARAAAKADKLFWELLNMEETDNDS